MELYTTMCNEEFIIYFLGGGAYIGEHKDTMKHRQACRYETPDYENNAM